VVHVFSVSFYLNHRGTEAQRKKGICRSIEHRDESQRREFWMLRGRKYNLEAAKELRDSPPMNLTRLVKTAKSIPTLYATHPTPVD
jgi:hypothetical protein